MSCSTWFGLILACTIIMSINCDSTKSSYHTILENSDIKNEAIKRPSFFVGSRYGRSQYYGPQSSRNVNVVPRNDRFFLGSRYGKRSDELMLDMVDPEPSRDLKILPAGAVMRCIYTGVKDFYRCYQEVKDDTNIYSDRSTSTSNNLEDEHK